MNRIIALAIAALVWTVAVFCVGYQVRDGKADTAVATVATQAQAARADNAEQARATDHAQVQAATKTEQQRVDLASERDKTFTTIEAKANTYAKANPDDPSCDLDGDGLQAWRDANAGTLAAEPDDPIGAARVVPDNAPRSRER